MTESSRMVGVTDLGASPDGAIVSIGFGDDWLDTAELLHVATIDEARRWLERRGPSWRGRYEAVLECETAQRSAAVAIGVSEADMCIRLRLHRAKPPGFLRPKVYGTHPELMIRHRGPKLAIAAVYAAPMQPTAFDLDRLRAFGYDGVIDVAQRVARWNADPGNELRIPPPLSS